MIRALMDTNVILDALLERSPWDLNAKTLWQIQRSDQFIAFITANSLTDVFYLSRRYAGLEKAWQVVHIILDQLPIIPIGRNELQLAATLDGNDFEDNLQLACALYMQLDVIVTRNFSGFNHDSISILSPQEMLLRLSQEQ